VREGAPSPLDLGSLGFDQGAHILVERALAACAELVVVSSRPEFTVQASAWCRVRGHGAESLGNGSMRIRARALTQRAERAGSVRRPEAHAPSRWGLAARGALVEETGVGFRFAIEDRDAVWTDDAARLYAQAAAAQWDPETAIPWNAPMSHPDQVEDAVVQVMTYLIENEIAALYVPTRFLPEIHPHFREVVQVLAIQAADEARHIEVFTRRASLRRGELGLSTRGGQMSLKTLFEEPDFALSAFLLSTLGEGSFLHLLRFLEANAPDPVTAAVCRLAAVDEARHVAFGLSHLRAQAERDPGLRPRMAAAVHRRFDALRETAGLNELVFDALVLLAAGSFEPEAIARGWQRVADLQVEMDDGRRHRLVRLGFEPAEAVELAGLHTRNFM